MKKIDAGQTMAILANLGVLVGIVFLAIEIRGANIQTRVVNQTAIVGQTVDSLLSIANDADSSSTYFRGMTGYAALSDEDKVRFDLMMQAILPYSEIQRLAPAREPLADIRPPFRKAERPETGSLVIRASLEIDSDH